MIHYSETQAPNLSLSHNSHKTREKGVKIDKRDSPELRTGVPCQIRPRRRRKPPGSPDFEKKRRE